MYILPPYGDADDDRFYMFVGERGRYSTVSHTVLYHMFYWFPLLLVIFAIFCFVSEAQ